MRGNHEATARKNGYIQTYLKIQNNTIHIFGYIYNESKRIRKISVTLSFTPWGDRQTVFYYGEKHTLYTIIYDITACEDVN